MFDILININLSFQIFLVAFFNKVTNRIRIYKFVMFYLLSIRLSVLQIFPQPQFQLFLIATMVLKSTRINLVMWKREIIRNIMGNLSEIPIIFPLPYDGQYLWLMKYATSFSCNASTKKFFRTTAIMLLLYFL